MADYIELNMANYDEAEVEQLNSWAIEAAKLLDSIVGHAAVDWLDAWQQEALCQLTGQPMEDEQ